MSDEHKCYQCGCEIGHEGGTYVGQSLRHSMDVDCVKRLLSAKEAVERERDAKHDELLRTINRLNDADDENATLRSQLEQAREALKETQWGIRVCPVCDGSEKQGHASDCVVGMALAALGEQPATAYRALCRELREALTEIGSNPGTTEEGWRCASIANALLTRPDVREA